MGGRTENWKGPKVNFCKVKWFGWWVECGAEILGARIPTYENDGSPSTPNVPHYSRGAVSISNSGEATDIGISKRRDFTFIIDYLKLEMLFIKNS